MKKTYPGSCHCGTVRFEADLDLRAGTFECNCISCLDDVNVDELMAAPMAYFDGLHDNYESPPQEIRHL